MFTNGVEFSDIDWSSIAGKVTEAYGKRQAQKAANLASDTRLQQQAIALQQQNQPLSLQQQSDTILGMQPMMFYGVSAVGLLSVGFLAYALTKSKKSN